jgi:hypothetical protein
MYTSKERVRYNEDRKRACERLGITKNQYNWFRREGEKLRNMFEDHCNGVWGSLEDDYQVEVQIVEDRIFDKIRSFKLFGYLQTDPRGATIYLDKVAIPENKYNQAVCIY